MEINSIGFLAPKNVDLTIEILILGNLGGEIWRNSFLKEAIFKRPRKKWQHWFSDLLRYKVSKNI